MESGAPDAENDERFYGIGPSPQDRKKSRNHKRSATGTPRSGGTPQHDRVASEDFDDHMHGSAFDPDDICKGCGFPRKSSVWCPITQRHHGTDEIMTQTGHHQRGASGGGATAGIKFLKGVWNKVSPQHNSAQHGASAVTTPQDTPRVRGAGLPPLSPSHQPPPGQESTSTSGKAGADADAADGRDSTVAHSGEGHQGEAEADPKVQYIQGPDGYYYAYTPGDDAAEADAGAAGEGEEGGGGGGEEANVQYYCYTDENGETFYYAAEMEESMTMQRQQSQSANRSRAATMAGTEGEAEAHEEAVPEESYVYHVKDEDGKTVQSVLAGPSAPANDAGSSEARKGKREQGGGDESKGDAAEAPKKKKTFGDTIAELFKPKPKKTKKGKKGKEETEGKHVDPNAAGEGEGEGEGDAPAAAGASGTLETGSEGIVNHAEAGGSAAEVPPSPTEEARLASVDAAVAAFVESLEPSDRKKFEKERKKLLKELDLAEKKEREHLVKQRKVFTEDLVRERRAGVFVLQAEERVIKRGGNKGEPR